MGIRVRRESGGCLAPIVTIPTCSLPHYSKHREGRISGKWSVPAEGHKERADPEADRQVDDPHPGRAHYALVAKNFQDVNVKNPEAELQPRSEHLDKEQSKRTWMENGVNKVQTNSGMK